MRFLLLKHIWYQQKWNICVIKSWNGFAIQSIMNPLVAMFEKEYFPKEILAVMKLFCICGDRYIQTTGDKIV